MAATYFYTITLSFLLGVAAASLFTVATAVLWWCLVLAVALALLRLRKSDQTADTFLTLICLFLIGVSLGGARMELERINDLPSVLATKVGQTVTIEGVVRAEPDQREKTTQLRVTTKDTVLLVFVDRYVNVEYGDRVAVTGRLALPEAFTTDFGRTFDYPGYLKAQGVSYRISFATVEVVGSGYGNPIIAGLLHFKAAFIKKTRALIAEPAAGLAEGLLLGVKQALGEELETAFRRTGIIHIVVLSGYNIMLVVAFVMFVLGYFLSPRPRVVFGLLAILAFSLMVGLSATVVRASLMASMLLLAQAFGRTYLVLRGLILAGVVMVAINPLVLFYDVGFQLSFLATLGLILIAPHFDSWLSSLPNWAGARKFLVATVATQIAVLPLLLYQIGEFSVVSVLVNVLVLPMVPVSMLLTFITGLVAFLSPALAALFAFPTYWSLLYIIEIAQFFAASPLAAFTVPSFSVWYAVVGYFLMALALWYWYRPEQAFGEADLGASLLNLSDQKNKDDQIKLDDWVIEEEFDRPLNKEAGPGSEISKKAGEAKATPAKKDPILPIFFR